MLYSCSNKFGHCASFLSSTSYIRTFARNSLLHTNWTVQSFNDKEVSFPHAVFASSVSHARGGHGKRLYGVCHYALHKLSQRPLGEIEILELCRLLSKTSSSGSSHKSLATLVSSLFYLTTSSLTRVTYYSQVFWFHSQCNELFLCSFSCQCANDLTQIVIVWWSEEEEEARFSSFYGQRGTEYVCGEDS